MLDNEISVTPVPPLAMTSEAEYRQKIKQLEYQVQQVKMQLEEAKVREEEAKVRQEQLER